jgi:hypothetical protein
MLHAHAWGFRLKKHNLVLMLGSRTELILSRSLADDGEQSSASNNAVDLTYLDLSGDDG